MSNINISHVVCVGAMALALSACKTTEKRTLQAPSLAYKTAAVCTQAISFDKAIRRTDEAKKRNREMRKRMIELKQEMANKDVPCLHDGKGQTIPYTVFEIPTDLEKNVVNAGSKYDEAVIFAAKVTTHDENGQLVRKFEETDYRRLGSVYGVQFSPRETEKYVLIQADPSLVGGREETVETGARRRYVSTYGANNYGGGGTNLRGLQKSFIRTYSYNGQAAVQTVFPKQKSKK